MRPWALRPRSGLPSRPRPRPIAVLCAQIYLVPALQQALFGLWIILAVAALASHLRTKGGRQVHISAAHESKTVCLHKKLRGVSRTRSLRQEICLNTQCILPILRRQFPHNSRLSCFKNVFHWVRGEPVCKGLGLGCSLLTANVMARSNLLLSPTLWKKFVNLRQSTGKFVSDLQS